MTRIQAPLDSITSYIVPQHDAEHSRAIPVFVFIDPCRPIDSNVDFQNVGTYKSKPATISCFQTTRKLTNKSLKLTWFEPKEHDGCVVAIQECA